MKSLIQCILVILSTLFVACNCWKHKLKVNGDYRPSIMLTSFGLYQRGYIEVLFEDFHYNPINLNSTVGFTLEKTVNDQIAIDDVSGNECFLEEIMHNLDAKLIAYLRLELKNEQLTVNCNPELNGLYFYNDTSSIPTRLTDATVDNEIGVPEIKGKSCRNLVLPVDAKNSSSGIVYSTKFTVYVPSEKEEGFYTLYFHNCANDYRVSFNVRIEARNRFSELSAGDIPLPDMYFFMAIVFYIASCVWIYVLIKSRHTVFAIHYLMAVVAVLKSVSLLLHGTNYHFIEKTGERAYPWATIYYIAYLLRGFLFFATIILIGTGWTFVKHILSKKDKKIFMVVLPLQVFANVAKIIIEESEVGDPAYNLWSIIFTFIDLVCCGAIMLPIIWSINHLQSASHVDGKAAISLNKLKLFRYFYMTVVIYVYSTRMLAILLKVTIPFQYSWLNELFKESATLVFFIMTGYTFRPTPSNPYFEASRNDDNEMDICVTQCGITEGLTRLSRISNELGDDDKDTLLIYKRDGMDE